jgi:hypothetical protein
LKHDGLPQFGGPSFLLKTGRRICTEHKNKFQSVAFLKKTFKIRLTLEQNFATIQTVKTGGEDAAAIPKFI